MATVYVPNVIEIAVEQSQGGRPVVNVWHMWFDAELGTDTIEDVVGDFRDNWQDHVTASQSNDISLIGFSWRSLDPDNSSLGNVGLATGKASAGQMNLPAAPPNVAMLLHKVTDNRPRGRRDGMSFIAGLAEGHVNGAGVLDTTWRSAYQTNFNSFYNGISDTSGTASGDRYPVVLETTAASRAPGTQPVVIGSRRVTSLVVDQRAATQRDRLR